MPFDPALGQEGFCSLTTVGRVSGVPREIEIWFALDGTTLFMLSGGRDRSNWVKNLLREPAVTVRIAGTTLAGRARVVERPEEDRRARRLLVEKYRRPGRELSNWERTALPVAVDFA